MTKLTKYEMSTGHRASDCGCIAKYGFCNEESSACVLFMCKVCKGAEGELTSECCGRRMTEEECTEVLQGNLDYKRGEWIKLRWD